MIDQLNAGVESRKKVKVGDLIVAVDGVGLSALMADQDAVERLASRKVVDRNGQEITVDVEGDVIRSILQQN